MATDGISSGCHGNSNEVGIAILGVGRIGTVHLENLCADRRAKILWLVDEENTFLRLRGLLTKYHLEEKTSLTTPAQVEQIYEDPRVEAVFICSPAPQHKDHIQAALAAGKHVFAEKPVSLCVEDVESLYSLANRQQRILFCGFNRRFDPQLRKMQQAVKRGDIGDLRMIKICSRDPPTHIPANYLKSSGGMFVDSMIHDFDMIYWLVNEIPESVVAVGHAFGNSVMENGDVDSAAVILKFKSGLVAVLDNSRIAVYGYDQRVEVMGSKGMLVSANPRSSYLEHWSEAGTTLDKPYYSCMDRYADSYVHEVKHFLDALEGNVEVEDPSGTGSILALRLAMLCEKSRKTGQVISL